MNITLVSATGDSQQIIDVTAPRPIMAGAGTGKAGRIFPHLRPHLWKLKTHILSVGCPSHGSLGRPLVNGRTAVKIHGERIAALATPIQNRFLQTPSLPAMGEVIEL
jgi:metallo-beta-lactamase family protein